MIRDIIGPACRIALGIGALIMIVGAYQFVSRPPGVKFSLAASGMPVFCLGLAVVAISALLLAVRDTIPPRRGE